MRAALSILFSLIVCTAWAADEKTALVAPGVLPGVAAEMRSPGFWTARHPSADERVLDQKGIEVLNRRITGEGLIEDLGRSPMVLPGVKVRAQLSGMIEGLKGKTLFGADGKAVSPDFVAGFSREVDAVPEKVDVLFGFIVKPAAQRLLPAAEPLYTEPGDVDFDEVQNSGLDIGTPVTVLAHSRDRQWLFVHAAISTGWVSADAVTRASYDIFSKKADPVRPLVITSSRADIFSDMAMSEYMATARMGSVFFYKSTSAAFWIVDVPVAGADGQAKFVPGYIPKKDASAGFLPFTPRVIYEQAFKLLDAPYGWGDMNGGQDCSRFLQMVFASVGIQLPRNSAEQGVVGVMIDGFKEGLSLSEKTGLIVKQGLGAMIILRLKGHIMLYLGSYNDKPYAIHSTWSYREPMPDGTERQRVIGRVAVTSLDLGAGSSKGSLLSRVISARILK